MKTGHVAIHSTTSRTELNTAEIAVHAVIQRAIPDMHAHVLSAAPLTAVQTVQPAEGDFHEIKFFSSICLFNLPLKTNYKFIYIMKSIVH